MMNGKGKRRTRKGGNVDGKRKSKRGRGETARRGKGKGKGKRGGGVCEGTLLLHT